MKRLIIRFLVLTALLSAICTFSYADPITLLAGQRVSYSGTAVIQGAGGAYNASSSISFSLSGDGSTLTITVANSGSDFPSSGALLTGIGFSANSSTGTPVFSSTASAMATYTSFGGGTGLWTVNPVNSNSNGLTFGGSLAIQTTGTATFTLTGGAVQSVMLNNVDFSYAPGAKATGIPGPISPPATPTPEPATIALLGSGLGALALRIRRRRNKFQDQ